jgi:hypothetical protein
VTAIFAVVPDVRVNQPDEILLAEDYNVVEQLAA